MEANKNNQTVQAASSNKPLSGTAEPSNWEKAATLIAGDNQLMSVLLKLIISPFTLLAGGGLIIYLFIKNKSYKDEIAGLKVENEKLSGEAENLRGRYKKLKKVFEIEQARPAKLMLGQGGQAHIHEESKNKLGLLD
jgi:cell division protein FtsB